MTNLGSVLKSRDITLPTKVHIVKAMVFPSASYGFPISVDGKESACNAGDRDLILVGKIPWRREWQSEDDMYSDEVKFFQTCEVIIIE